MGVQCVNLKRIWPRRASKARAVHAVGVGVGGGFSRGGCLNAIYGHGRLYEMGTEAYASLRYTGQCQARSR